MLETVLETERLRLTNWLPEHLPDLVRLHGYPEVTRYFSEHGRPETEDQARTRLKHWADLFKTRRLGKLRVTDKETGTFLGRAGYGVYGSTAMPEIGYAFLPANWGKGYATEAATGLRDWYFRETDGAEFVGFAHIGNHASIQVLKKIGMIPTHVAAIDTGIACQFLTYHRNDWETRKDG